MSKIFFKKSGDIWELVKTIIAAVLIAGVVRTAAYEPFNIPSGSMVPTLLVGDYLFVSKFSYGYSKYSLPFSLPIISDRIFFTGPKRGDVIVFRKPTDPNTDYIKRLIGMPGERIQMINGRLHINSQKVKRRQIASRPRYDPFGRRISVPQFIETLPNGTAYKILELMGDKGDADQTKVFSVPPKHYFMMGDNRDNSVDSRDKSVGMVPVENLIGRAEILFWAWDTRWSWWQIWNWPRAIRINRIFSVIQ